MPLKSWKLASIMDSIKNPLFFILGPTGVGKSKFSLEISKKYKGSILNSDSLQVYRGVPIGTNQPSREDQKKIPHFLFHFVKEGVQFTAGEYQKLALHRIEKEIHKGPVWCVGGSGFYIQALEKGMFKVKKIPDEFIRNLQKELNERGKDAFYIEIKKKDPEYAQSISLNDTYRILRGVATIRFFKTKISNLKKKKMKTSLPFPFYKLGLFLEKEQLKERLKRRIQEMFKRGFIEEVETLLNQGYVEWSLLRSVGYKECVEFLKGKISKENLENQILIRNMQLVKKQMTWFKRDSFIRWFHALREEDKAWKWVEDQLYRNRV